jgi:hypothetical protein
MHPMQLPVNNISAKQTLNGSLSILEVGTIMEGSPWPRHYPRHKPGVLGFQIYLGGVALQRDDVNVLHLAVWMMNNLYEHCGYQVWSKLCSCLIPWSQLLEEQRLKKTKHTPNSA